MKLISGIALTLLCHIALAQQDAMYTHYMFNTQAVNPAYAGSREALSVTTLHRSQWASHFPKNPVTQSLTLHTPLRNENIGMGLSIFNDRLGPEKTTSVFADFAYRIQVSDYGKLSFGLKGGLSMHSIDYDILNPEQADDPVLRNNENSLWLPNFGFGMYYTNNKFYAGFSIPQLIEENFLSNTVVGGAKFALQRHYYFIAGTVLKFSDDINFKPTTYIKMTKGVPVEVDLTANFQFYDRFLLGVMFRTRDAIGALAGFQINEQWAIGYSYDWSVLNQIPNNNFGSHEIVLRYDMFFLESHHIKSPRHF